MRYTNLFVLEGHNLAASKNKTAPRRISFAKISEPLEVPNLLALQRESFDWLLGNAEWRERMANSPESLRGELPSQSGLEIGRAHV